MKINEMKKICISLYNNNIICLIGSKVFLIIEYDMYSIPGVFSFNLQKQTENSSND